MKEQNAAVIESPAEVVENVTMVKGIAVHTGIPLPARTRNGEGNNKYPWDKGSGHCFFIAGGKRSLNSIQSGLSISAKRANVKIDTRRGLAQTLGFKDEALTGKMGIGCWIR